MKVEDCIVAVERRSLGGCLDLAFVFAREFAAPITRLTLMFAVPACALVWLIASYSTDMLMPSVLIFLCFSSLYNGALIAAVGPQVFGVSISTRHALRDLRKRLFSYGFLAFLYRFLLFMSMFCMVFPSLIVATHFGHLPEVMMLEQTPFSRVLQRLSWLGRGGGFGRNFSRVLGLMAFWALFSVGLFFIIDLLMLVLFHIPVFTGQFTGGQMFSGDQLASVVLDSPVFLTVVHVALWLPFPVVRLAWFFCYLDQRIRNECWDLELQFRVEAARLEGLA